MNIKKLLPRLAIFFLGIPAILAVVHFNQLHSLILHIVILLAVIASSFEMHNLLSAKGKMAPKALLIVLSCVPTIVSYLSFYLDYHTEWIFISFVFCSILCCLVEVIWPVNKGENNFDASIHAITSDIFLLSYCSLLPVFISLLSCFHYSVAYISTYFILVFSCDSFAWLFGMLFGKNNRGIIKVSPNKSVAGFIGGIVCTTGMAVLCKLIFAQAFAEIPYWGMVLMGFGSSILAIGGDLVESLIKRSADIKDSGKIILGRGGMLDSIDSLLFVIPFFYAIIRIFIAKS